MAIAARLPLAAWRNEAHSWTMRFVGIDLTGKALRMQVRLAPDTPGAPLIDLGTVDTAAAEGLKFEGVTLRNGVPISTITGRLNKTTMSDAAKLPFGGERGDDTQLSYAMQIDGRTRVYGAFTALAAVMDSDAATAASSSHGGGARGGAPWSAAELTFGDDMAQVSIDGVTLLEPLLAAAAGFAADAADAAADASVIRADVAAMFTGVEGALDAVAGLGSVIARGLLMRSDGTLAGWTGGTDKWAVSDVPALTSFDRSPIPVLTPGAGSDAGGIREGCIFDDDDGARYLFYGAGDGSQGPGGPWRVHLARTVDDGLNWERLGPLNPELGHGYDGGSYPATDMLHVEKRDGLYVLHRMSAGAVTSNQVPSQPYFSDLWIAPAITGPYSFVRKTFEAGAPGSFDATDSIASSIVDDGLGTFHHFYSATNAGKYQIGRATSASPQGPFVKTGVPVLPATFITGSPENPKVSWHPGLSRWAMLTNQITGGFTGYNRLFLSKSLTDWSKALYCDYTPLSPMAGIKAIGLCSGFYGPTNVPALDFVSNSVGSYPITYDTDPTDANHIGRTLFYTVLEASTAGLLTAAAPYRDDFTALALSDVGGQAGWIDLSRVGPRPQIVEGGVLDLGAAPGTATGHPLVVRDAPGKSIAQRMMMGIGGNCSVAQIFGYAPEPGVSRFLFVAFGAGLVEVGAFDGVAVELLGSANLPSTPNARFCEAVYNSDTGRLSVYSDYQPMLTSDLSATHQDWVETGQIGLRSGGGGTGARFVYSYAASAPIAASDPPVFRSFAHGSFVAEFAVRPALDDAHLDLFYHLQDAGSTEAAYRLRLNLAGAGAVCGGLYRRRGGAETQIAGATATRTQTSSPTRYTAVRIQVGANVHQVWINGEKQFQAYDDRFTAGEAIAFAGSGEMDIRMLSFRKGNGVTVGGLAAGQVVTLRGSGRIPLATATATGPDVTLAIEHYPATSIDVDGEQALSPAGGIWGGSVFRA